MFYSFFSCSHTNHRKPLLSLLLCDYGEQILQMCTLNCSQAVCWVQGGVARGNCYQADETGKHLVKNNQIGEEYPK